MWRTGQYGAQATYNWQYGQQNMYGALAQQNKPAAAMGGMMGRIDPLEQSRIAEEKRWENEKLKKELWEQQRQERRLSESINGCVLWTSNAERAYLRVKDSQAVSQLFASENLKPVDLVKYSSEVDKGLRW